MATSIELQIRPYERAFVNRRWDADAADTAVLTRAVDLLAERAYVTNEGIVRVRIDWSPLIERPPEPDLDDEDFEEIDDLRRVAMQFIDERDGTRDTDLVSFTELFLHDAFLILNVAAPGSFGGAIRWSGGGFRDRDLLFDARVFELAAVTAAVEGWPAIEPLSLSDVITWYDSLGIGIQQLATTNMARALFHLLYLARGEEDDTMSVVRLALALEAVFDARGAFLGPRIESLLGRSQSLHDELGRFTSDRDAIVLGTAPVAHPLYDDGLDARADDPSLNYTGVVDFASSVIVGALQQQVRARSRLTLVV